MPTLLIDGYNVIFKSPAANLPVLEEQRAWLIQALIRYHQKNSDPIILVFDSRLEYQPQIDDHPPSFLKVVYTDRVVTADDWIIDWLNHHDGQKYLVISSDKQIQKAAQKNKARFLGAGSFLADLLSDSIDEIDEDEKRALMRHERLSKKHWSKKKGPKKRAPKNQR